MLEVCCLSSFGYFSDKILWQKQHMRMGFFLLTGQGTVQGREVNAAEIRGSSHITNSEETQRAKYGHTVLPSPLRQGPACNQRTTFDNTSRHTHSLYYTVWNIFMPIRNRLLKTKKRK